MDRRHVVIAGGASLVAPAVFASRQRYGVSRTELLLGQSAVLSGPLSAGALVVQAGAKLAFEEVNAKGGVNRRQIRLVSLDDGFVPDRAHENYEALVRKHEVFACVLGTGTATTLAGLPVLTQAGVPLIAPTAVIDSARNRTQGIAYYTRATQQREADALVSHFTTLGLQKLAVAHIATPGGQEALAQIQNAVQRSALQIVGSAAVAPDGSNVADAGKSLASTGAQAVLMYLTGPVVAALMKAVMANGAAPSFYGTSIVSGDATAKLLGDDFKGMAICAVTSYPWDAANQEAGRYRKLCESANVPVGYLSYEGYIAGRVVVEALHLAGRNPTRDRLHGALRRLKLAVAGMDFDFTNGSHTGTQFVEMVRVRLDGKYVR